MKITEKLNSLGVSNDICNYIDSLDDKLKSKAFAICKDNVSINLDELKIYVPNKVKKSNLYNDKIMSLPKKYRELANEMSEINDIDRVISAAKEYEKKKTKLKHQHIEHYSSLKELTDDIGGIIGDNDVLCNKIYEDDTYLCVRIDSLEASIKYGKGTKWCLTSKSDPYFYDYLSDNVIYFIINKKKNSLNDTNAKICFLCNDTSVKHKKYADSYGYEYYFDAKNTTLPSIWSTEDFGIVKLYEEVLIPLIKDDYFAFKKTPLYKLHRSNCLSYEDVQSIEKIIGKEKICKEIYKGNITLRGKIDVSFYPENFKHNYYTLNTLSKNSLLEIIDKKVSQKKTIGHEVHAIPKNALQRLISAKMNNDALYYMIRNIRINHLHKLIDKINNKEYLYEMYNRYKRKHDPKFAKYIKEIKKKIKEVSK